MIKELHIASKALQAALERYLDICLAISSSCDPVDAVEEIADAFFEEFQKATSYESRINHVKSIIGKLQNRYSSISPINSLPPEILAFIFRLAHSPDCNLLPELPIVKTSLKSQTIWTLLHVCSYWRAFALGLQDLWTHVDLAPFSSAGKWMLGRAKQFIPWSGDLPLAIHAIIGDYSMSDSYQNTLELCTQIAPRAKAINLSLATRIPSNLLTIYEGLLLNCVPGQLTSLTIQRYNHSLPQPPFIGANNPHASPESQASHEYTEQVLRYITILSLAGVYLDWSSQAYTGLVSLRLQDRGLRISASSLSSVLRASPQLCFFWFGVLLLPEIETDIAPVQLGQLQVLYLEFESLEDHERVLSFIHPGAGPLCMSTYFEDDDTPESAQPLIGGEHRRFFQRSNVVRLRASGPACARFIVTTELLQLVPNLQVLYLSEFDVTHCIGSELYLLPNLNLQLTELRLQAVGIELGALKYIIDACPITRVVMDPEWCRVVAYGETNKPDDYWLGLANMFPMVELVAGLSGLSEEVWY